MSRIQLTRAGELAFRQLPGRLSADPLAGVDAGAVSVRLVHLTEQGRNPHRHPHCVELIYVLEGEGTFWQEGETEPLRAGDLVLVPAGAAHATVPHVGGEMHLYCVFPVARLDGEIEELEGEIRL
ncbi:MAG TPA: cupin domain-containing protein [Gaiellaceae bacterium]